MGMKKTSGLRVYWSDVPEPEPRKNKTVEGIQNADKNCWRCLGCNGVFINLNEYLICPVCEERTSWLAVTNPKEGEKVQDIRALGARKFGAIDSVSGITKSARPCQIETCGGTMYALLYKYKPNSDGVREHRLIWRCNRCKVEVESAEGSAVTKEPEIPA